MPKLKTKKTAKKRIKISKNGKLLRKKVRTGHLKTKWSTNRRFRKNAGGKVKNRGHINVFKGLLGKLGGKID